jgi:hypothetical protein
VPLAPEVAAGRPGSPGAACHLGAECAKLGRAGRDRTAREIHVHLRGVSAKEITAIFNRDNPR